MTQTNSRRAAHSPWVWGMLFVGGLIVSITLSGYAALLGVHLAGVKADALKRTASVALNLGAVWGLILFMVLFPWLKRKVASPYAAFGAALGSVGLIALVLSYLLHGFSF